MVRLAKISHLSVYTHSEAHLQQKTLHGAIVTILGILLATLLFTTEFNSCFKKRVVQEMTVNSKKGQSLAITLNVTLPSLPCQAINFDVRDISGVRQTDSNLARGGGIHKIRLDKLGKRMGMEYFYPGHKLDFSMLARDRQIVSELEQALDSEEGCNIYGVVHVQRVAGTLVISVHLEDFFALPENVLQLKDAIKRRVERKKGIDPDQPPDYNDPALQVELDTTRINVSHRISELSFGPPFPGSENPLSGTSRIGDKFGGIYRYYMQVVPTEYRTIKGKEYNANQYSVTEYFSPIRKGDGKLPGVYFMYDISPIQMVYTEKRLGLWHFLVRICAVVGGVFAVTGMVDRWVHRLVTAVFVPNHVNRHPTHPPPNVHHAAFNTGSFKAY